MDSKRFLALKAGLEDAVELMPSSVLLENSRSGFVRVDLPGELGLVSARTTVVDSRAGILKEISANTPLQASVDIEKAAQLRTELIALLREAPPE